MGRLFGPLIPPRREGSRSPLVRSRLTLLLLSLGFLLPLLLVVDNVPLVARHIGLVHGWVAVVAYLGFYLLVSAAILLLMLSEPRRLGLTVFIITVSSAIISAGYRTMAPAGFGVIEGRVLLGESAYAADALTSFLLPSLLPVLLAIAVARLLYLLLFRRIGPIVRRDVAMMLAAVLLLITLSPAGNPTMFLPAFLRVPASLSAALLHSHAPRPRPAPPFGPSNRPAARHLLLVIDESIRGDHLSINGYARPTTPSLHRLGARLANFGVASSTTNCSSSATLLLLTGLPPEALPDRGLRSLEGTTLISWAREAGLEVRLLDAGIGEGIAEGFAPEDRPQNDSLLARQLESSRREERDLLLGRRVAELLHRTPPSLIIVRKAGAHFHYERSYPQSGRRFTPTLDPTDAIDEGLRTSNSYDNALLWSVDGFFRTIGPALAEADAILFYTSDHGEALHEERGLGGHCRTVDPAIGEGLVPLMVIAGGGLREERAFDCIRQGAVRGYGRSSAFQIAPTILWAMGYDRERLRSLFAIDLLGEPPVRRAFFSGDLYGDGLYDRTTVPPFARLPLSP